MLRTVFYQSTRSLYATQVVQAGRTWRRRQGLEDNQLVNTPLLDLPDWSYVDGRPGPLNAGTVRRRGEMADFTKEAVQLMGQMTETREMHTVRDGKQQTSNEFKSRTKQNTFEKRWVRK